MEPILRIENIDKYYGNKSNLTKALSHLSLNIDKGEFVAIMGASGSGKTTLLNCVSTIDRVTAGHIYVGKTDITKLKGNHLNRFRREELGFIFQDFNLLDTLTAYENIALGLKLRNMPRNVIDTRVKTAVKFFGIEDVLNKKVTELTDAQKQKIALCRATVCHPKVLLVDEDFAHGSDELRADMLQDIQRINKELNLTVLYVTNNYEEATSLDGKLILMKDGQITNQ